MAKTVCSITRNEFAQRAKTVKVTVEYEGKTSTFLVSPREFESGSMGYNLSDKATFTMEGRDVRMQLGMNITVIGSKDLPKEQAPAAAA
jgi:hypothetical protein